MAPKNPSLSVRWQLKKKKNPEEPGFKVWPIIFPTPERSVPLRSDVGKWKQL